MVPAQRQGRFAVEELGRCYERARLLFPAPSVEEPASRQTQYGYRRINPA